MVWYYKGGACRLSLVDYVERIQPLEHLLIQGTLGKTNMSSILILIEEPTALKKLKRLFFESSHKLKAVECPRDLYEALKREQVDLIVVAAHLETSNVFSILRTLKEDDDLRQIPIIVIRVRETQFARLCDESIGTATEVMGAEKYIVFEELSTTQLLSEISELLSTNR